MTTPTTEQLAALLERVQKATGQEYRWIWQVYRLCPVEWRGGDVQRQAFEQVLARYVNAKAFVDAALALVGRVLPGWGWKVGGCHLSDDAFLFPDFNSPEHGDRLKRKFPELHGHREWSDVTDIDRRPAGNPALALLESLLTALIAQAKERGE